MPSKEHSVRSEEPYMTVALYDSEEPYMTVYRALPSKEHSGLYDIVYNIIVSLTALKKVL